MEHFLAIFEISLVPLSMMVNMYYQSNALDFLFLTKYLRLFFSMWLQSNILLQHQKVLYGTLTPWIFIWNTFYGNFQKKK